MNPYLKRLRTQYDALRASIEGLQTRAAAEDRDLTDAELRSIEEQSKQGQTLYTQIELLTDNETRSAKVGELAAAIATGTGDTETTHTRAVGGATTRDRDPGHYRSVKDGGTNSFFRDLYRSKVNSDELAQRRLVEHTRALDTTGEGVGIVPPKWLASEFETIDRQGRALANAVRNIPLGDDPRPMTLPKQTAGADSTNPAQQAAENDPVPNADKWDSDVDTVTPKPTAGKQEVSRQMMDMSSPAIDQLIYGDMMEEYDLQVEKKVGAAILAAGAETATTTFTLFATMGTAETNGSDLVVRAAIDVRNARKRPADILAMEVNTYGRFLKLKDSSNRPLIPLDSNGPMNVIGVGSVAVDGRIHGLGVIASDGMDDGVANQETFAAIKAGDTILFESNMLRFRFEEVKGPETVVLGIWGYTAVIVRKGGRGVRRIRLTT